MTAAAAKKIRRRSAVVMACSTGGLRALLTILPGLDPRLRVPIVLVCHSGSQDADLLCELLARDCPLPVREAEERRPAAAGVVHVAPSGYHLYLEHDFTFTLSIDPKVLYVRPAADVLFTSAAEAWAAELLGIVMTGANADGASGLLQVRRRGGHAIVQDPSDAEARQMPEAAIRLAGADDILPLTLIAARLNELCA